MRICRYFNQKRYHSYDYLYTEFVLLMLNYVEFELIGASLYHFNDMNPSKLPVLFNRDPLKSIGASYKYGNMLTGFIFILIWLQIKREISIMKIVRHPYIVRLQEV